MKTKHFTGGWPGNTVVPGRTGTAGKVFRLGILVLQTLHVKEKVHFHRSVNSILKMDIIGHDAKRSRYSDVGRQPRLNGDERNG